MQMLKISSIEKKMLDFTHKKTVLSQGRGATSEVDAATVEAIVGVLEHEPVLPIIIVTNIELCRREHV